MSASGARLRQLTNDAAKDHSVTWSTDGRSLFFYSNRDGDDHIWTIRSDGSGLARVTDSADLRRLHENGIDSPAISPDGRTLAATTSRSGVLVHLDRTLAARTERIAEGFTRPKWSPDGKQILWSTKTGGVVVYSLDTHTARTVLDRGASPHWLPDNRHIAVLDKDSVGILDLDRGSVTKTPFQRQADSEHTRLSRDGSTIYQLQTQERGDIWIARFRKPNV